MSAVYLDWLVDVFEEAQVPFTPESAPELDRALRAIVNGPTMTEEEVYRHLRTRWLKHGRPGWQLLASHLRAEVFSGRDSPLRPKEGDGYYTNAYQTTAIVPGR